MVPDRLSYSEMALAEFKYPSEWTEDFGAYQRNQIALQGTIKNYMENYQNYLPNLNKQVKLLKDEFFSCNNLLNVLK